MFWLLKLKSLEKKELVVKIGDRVYIEFLDCFGHIQRIEDAVNAPPLIVHPPGTQTYWVKREDRESCAQGFKVEKLEKVEN